MRFGCTPRKIQLFSTFIALVAIVTVLTILFLFNWPSFARQRIIDALVFKNGSLGMERFMTTADMKNLRLSISVFNVTNTDEVVNSSAKMKLQEIGPFVYHEYKSKEFLDNNQISGLISYKLRRQFIFKPNLSVGDPKKMNLTWINLPVISTMDYIEKLPWTFRLAAYGLLRLSIIQTNEQPFITDTVENFIFSGSYRKLFTKTLLSEFVPKKLMPDGKFAILYDRNNSWIPGRDYVMTASAGFGLNQTYKDLNKYVYMNGSSKLSFWNDPGQCNTLGGTDGEFFAPFVNSSEKLEIFSLDVCRKLALKYQGDENIHGIPVYKYVLDEKTLQSGSKNPENNCYCISNSSKDCSLDGLIDLSRCVADGVVASGSHFLHGSPELLTRIDGVNPPNATIDEPVIHVEPNTGLAIQVNVPFQINAKLTKIDGYSIFKFFKDSKPLMVPLLIVTEAAELTDEQATALRNNLLILDSWFVSMVLGGAIVLILVIVIVIFVLGVHCKNSRQKSTGRQPRVPRETDALLA